MESNDFSRVGWPRQHRRGIRAAKWMVAFLLALCVLVFASEFVYAQEQQPTAQVLVAALNVRKGPGKNFGKVAVVQRGDALTILDQQGNCSWLKVLTPDGDEGWVSGGKAFVKISTPCSQILKVTPEPTATTDLTATSLPTVTASPTETTVPSSMPSSDTCPFFVYRSWNAEENHFTPAGWMGDYGDIGYDDNYRQDPDPQRDSVIQIAYSGAKTQGQGWAGIYWWDPPDSNWAQIDGGFDLSCATRVTFWARGENGGEWAEFKVGGLHGQYNDSFGPVSTGSFRLTEEWRQYSISLAGKDLSHVIGGFVWVTNTDKNRGNPNGATIYLDDIRYE